MRSKDADAIDSGKWTYSMRRAREMGFYLLERSAFGLRQYECRGEEVDDREGREKEEHRRVSMFADERQEDSCQERGYELVDHQCDAHAVGTDARGHELRECEPDTNAGAEGIERHE